MAKIDAQYQDILKPYNPIDRQMRYLKQFSQSIVTKADDFYLSIDRFNIPMTSIPIFIYQLTPHVDPITGLTTYTDTEYSIELEYNGVFSGQTFIQYVSNTPVTSSFYYYVFNYNAFIRMINTAISTAFTTLGGIITLPTGSVAPYFEIDQNTKMMSLVVQNNYFNGTIGWLPLKLYANIKMLRFLNGIPLEFTYQSPTRILLFIVEDLHNNLERRVPFDLTPTDPTLYDFLIMNSEYGAQTLINWNDAKGFVFTTDTLPINPENLPSTANQSMLVSRGILANFDFIYTESTPKPLSAQYILQSPYKKIDLISSVPINILDIAVAWYDYNNNLHECYLYDGEAMSIRLVFLRKKK